MKLRSLLALAVIAVSAAPFSGHATNVIGGSEVVVGILDTGVRATHQEFDYRGKTSTTDQMVGWWDFTDEKAAFHKPAVGQTWDTAVPEPFDNHGHGTATASMAVGRNIDSGKSQSYAPGFKFAAAKVGKKSTSDVGGATVNGDLGAAIRWLVYTIKVDVINMSIGQIAPLPAAVVNDVLTEIKHAHDAGVIFVAANGNGWGNTGAGPGAPGWASGYGESQYALAVGARAAQGLLVTTDPEVTAIYSVRAAARTGDNSYTNTSGTSFSAPTVAGMAAAAMKEAVLNGKSATSDRIEKLLKYSARDSSVYPPMTEGYGELDKTQFTTVVMTHAAAGTLPSRPANDVSGTYVEGVAGRLRAAWTNTANAELMRTNRNPGTAQGAIGTSTPHVQETEFYTLTLAPGQSATVKMSYVGASGVNDIDLFAYTPGPMSGATREKVSVGGPGVKETLTLGSPTGGTYTIAAVGHTVSSTQPISMDTTAGSLSYSGQDTTVFVYDGFGFLF